MTSEISQTMFYLYNIELNEIVELKKNIIDEIYYQRCIFPTEELIEKAKKTKNAEKYFKSKPYEELHREFKDNLSKIYERIPLYDAVVDNLFIIDKRNVYFRVVFSSYRFPDKDLLRILRKNKTKLDEKIITKNITDPLIKRKQHKYELMLNFLDNFNLDILYEKYIKVFYLYSSFVGKDLSTCKRKSFNPLFKHLKPYFTRSEIINMGLNQGIKLDPDKYLEPEDISEICEKIEDNEISSEMLLKHNNYITVNDKVGLIQYYTLQGSYFINQYMRKLISYDYKNDKLEEIIKPMWNLVLTAPEFDQSYTLYRFVHDDSHMNSINIGDIYTEKGFLSTTRDPFYRSDLYEFGFVLMKIKIPPGKKGVALCLETLSHFPEEQEIIFPPGSKFKLISRDKDCVYYHTDIDFSSAVKTKYEFEWIGNTEIKFEPRPEIRIKEPINFLKLENVSTVTLMEKIKFFIKNYVNDLGQFVIKVGDKEYTIICEYFDSTGAYHNLYGLMTTNGLLMYSFRENYFLFFIELGEIEGKHSMVVNFNSTYGGLDTGNTIGDMNFIRLLSEIGYYFEMQIILIYGESLNCTSDLQGENAINNITTSEFGQREFNGEQNANNIMTDSNKNSDYIRSGTYRVDIFKYFTTKKKRYDDINISRSEMYPGFLYSDLDALMKISPDTILSEKDRDEVYQVYQKVYLSENKKKTISDFYIWLRHNKCYLLDIFEYKMNRIFGENNPFFNYVYLLDPASFLYNRKLISIYPDYNEYESIINKSKSESVMKNKYRQDYVPKERNLRKK